MHEKFLNHGTGSGAGAASYLLGTHDHNGIERAEVKVLRGDPIMVGKVADSLHLKNRYTSGVIAFHKDDDPTPEQLEEVLNEYERVAFAGIDKKRVAYSAVLHRDQDGSCHIHIFAARVDLETGKSFNMAPPGWESAFDPHRDYFNLKYQWARPDDPERARTLQPGKRALIDAQMLKRGLEVEPDTKALITEYLEQQILAGRVTDRPSMLASIKEIGLGINRAGKDYITIIDEDGNKFRLKGAIYGEHFSTERALEITDSGRENIFGESIRGDVGAARKELEAAIQRRAKYNEHRYKSVPRELGRDSQRDLGADQVVDVVAPVGQPAPVTVDRGISQRVELVDVERHGQPGTSQAAANPAPDKRVLRESSGFESLQIGVNNDGIRNDIARAIDKIKQGVRSASEAISRALGRYDGALGRHDKELSSLESANGDFIKSVSGVETGVKRVIDNNIDEILAFKRDINLVEFAESLGYVKDKAESGKNSVMMRYGGDKIVIATKDDHGVYFNIHDDNDNGTIIDFLQRRERLNMGQVRQKLRPWLGIGATVLQRKPPAERPAKPIEASRDQAEVLKEYYRLGEYQIGYLEHERKLSPDTVRAFLPIIRTDARNNTCFVHSDSDGAVTGWEVKNKDFTGFSAGSKSLSVHSPDGQSNRLVICESMIDCMSFYELNGKAGDVYASIAGGMSPEQEKLLEGLCEGFKDIMLAVDKDDAGKKYAEQVRTWRPDAKWLVPTDGKDWNDALKVRAAQAKHERNRGSSQTLG